MVLKMLGKENGIDVSTAGIPFAKRDPVSVFNPEIQHGLTRFRLLLKARLFTPAEM